MARRLFIYDKKLGEVVEISRQPESESQASSHGPQGFVKNATANKRRLKSVARWPMVSENAGCQPEQVAEANAACKRHGIAAEYLPGGDVVWSSPKAKREHIRSIGLHDRDAFH